MIHRFMQEFMTYAPTPKTRLRVPLSRFFRGLMLHLTLPGFFTLVFFLHCFSANSLPLRHHIIIAIDKAGCDSWIGNEEVGREVQRLLLKQTFTEQAGREHLHLYEEGDYVSFVGFRLNQLQTDMSVFAMPMSGGEGPLAWQPLSKTELSSLLDTGWSTMVLRSYNPGNDGFSLVSVAKAYALCAVPSIEGRYTGRTFLVMVTDHHYNGNDFYDEIKSFNQLQQYYRVRRPLTEDSIFAKCYNVEQNYYIRYISHKEIAKNKYVEFYEYVPLQQNFSMQSTLRYPTHLRAVRKRDGSFEVKMDLQWLENSNYLFYRLEAFPNTSDQIIYDSPNNASVVESLPQTLTFTLPDSTTRHIQLRCWLVLNDGFYGGTMLSADEDSPRELGRDGLNVLIPIEYDANATIYGSTTAAKIGWDLLPWIDDQYAAAHVWEYYILPLIIIALLAFIGYRLARQEYYKPKAREFRIGKEE